MKVTNYQEPTIDPFGKGLGNLPGASVPLDEAGRLEWNLLAEDISLPAAVLYEERIEHNLNWMQAFVQQYGVQFAPHGKTTMAPQLFRRQPPQAHGASRSRPRTRRRPPITAACAACCSPTSWSAART